MFAPALDVQSKPGSRMGRIDKAQYADVVKRVKEAENQVVTAYNTQWNEVVK